MTNPRLQSGDFRITITSHQSPVTSHDSRFTIHCLSQSVRIAFCSSVGLSIGVILNFLLLID